MEISMEVPQKAKGRIIVRSSCTSPGHISKGMLSEYNRAICTPGFAAVVFTIVKLWNQLRCLTTDK
jgi:hypothetical protein